MNFIPLIWKSHCLSLTQKFTNRYIKSTEKKCYSRSHQLLLDCLSNHNGSV